MAENENFELVSGRRRNKRVRSVINNLNVDKKIIDRDFDVKIFNR